MLLYFFVLSDIVSNIHNVILLGLWHVMTNIFHKTYSILFDNIIIKRNIQSIKNIPKSYTVGFPNIRKTSYMGSTLRSLFCLPPFVSFIEEYVKFLTEDFKIDLENDNPFMYRLNRLVLDLKEGKCDLSNYKAIQEIMFQTYNTYIIGEQNSSFAFLEDFISLMETNINNLITKAQDSQDKSLIEIAEDILKNYKKLFYITIVTYYTCKSCEKKTHRFTSTDIKINIFNSNKTDVEDKISKRNIKDLLKEKFSKKISKKNKFYIKSEGCKKCDFVVEYKIIYQTNILILHFKEKKISKIDETTMYAERLVTYPTDELDLYDIFPIPENYKGVKTYLFSSAICHNNDGNRTLPIKAIAKVIQNNEDIPIFLEYQDSTVIEVNLDKDSLWKKYPPYLLFYYKEKERK